MNEKIACKYKQAFLQLDPGSPAQHKPPVKSQLTPSRELAPLSQTLVYVLVK